MSVIDFDKMYSLLVDTITFYFLIDLTDERNLDMCLMDVIIAYLYYSLDIDVFMKLLERLKFSKLNKTRELYSVKLQRSFYRLK